MSLEEWTAAPNSRAMRQVSSVDPESMTAISSIKGKRFINSVLMISISLPIVRASFKVGKAREIRIDCFSLSSTSRLMSEKCE